MKALVMHLHTRLDAPWSKTVYASDASGDGFGVCSASFDEELVRKTGSWLERWRFRRLLPHEWAPRRRALGELPEITDPTTATDSPLVTQQWKLRVGFPEVDHAFHKNSAPWKTLFAGPFRYTEHITLKEG